MKIAYVSSEVVPFAKTGGLADVAGALPIALKNLNCDVKVFMPKYYSVDENKFKLEYLSSVGELKVRSGGHIHHMHVFKGFLPDSTVEIYFIENPHFFHRHSLYTNDWDEDERFIIFNKTVIELMQYLGWGPDILHCNDWQTGLMPLLIKDNYSWDRLFKNTAFVFTIHNIGYQGVFDNGAAQKAELKHELYLPGGPVEHLGSINFLKAGIVFSEIVNTVSKTYSKELLTPEYGHGLEGILQQKTEDLYGVVNGVDYKIWNPEVDKLIPHNYSINDLSGKEKNKIALLAKMNLPYRENIPVIGIVSRLAIQKGFDIIGEALPNLLNLDAQWIILGSGEYEYQHLLNHNSHHNKDKMAVYIGYNNNLAHLIEAGSDMFLMPSHYEPCGLNQIYSLKYGTVPIVRKTGGLADTVQDWNEYNDYGQDIGNGFSFYEYSSRALIQSIERAINDYHNKPIWNKIIKNGMVKDYSWEKAASQYMDLYKKALIKKRR